MPVVVSGADVQTAQNTRGDSTGAVLRQVVHARCCVWCRCPDSAFNACGGGIGSGLWASASGTFVRSTTGEVETSLHGVGCLQIGMAVVEPCDTVLCVHPLLEQSTLGRCTTIAP